MAEMATYKVRVRGMKKIERAAKKAARALRKLVRLCARVSS